MPPAWLPELTRVNVESIPVEPGDYTAARVAPDGRRIALVVGDATAAAYRSPDIWIYDLETESARQLTAGFAADGPVWSNDGQHLYFRSTLDGARGVYRVSADGGEPELLAPHSPEFPFALPWSLSPDGETLALVNGITFTEVHSAILPLTGDRQLRTLLGSGQNEPFIAPNGAWLAHTAAGEAGEPPRIRVRSFPDVSGTGIEVGIGAAPVFSRDGSELFYLREGSIVGVPVEYEPTFRIGAPRPLVSGRYWTGIGGAGNALGRAWDVHPDGQRFLLILPSAEPAVTAVTPFERDRIHVVLNWFDQL